MLLFEKGNGLRFNDVTFQSNNNKLWATGTYNDICEAIDSTQERMPINTLIWLFRGFVYKFIEEKAENNWESIYFLHLKDSKFSLNRKYSFLF